MMLFWIDGRIVPAEAARLSPLDRGFTLGDGVFETMRAAGRRILWLDDHLARLRAAAALLGIPVPQDDAAIAAGLAALLDATGYPHSALRLTMSRGPSERRGLWPPGEPVIPTAIAGIAPLAPSRRSSRIIVAQLTRRNEHSPLSRIKSLNYGDNLLARREAEALGADDALMLNGGGGLACATVANVFLRLDGRWVTPPIEEGVLPGLARRRLLGLLAAEERRVDADDLARAEAGLLSNSLGLGTIGSLDGRPFAETEELAGRLEQQLFARST